MLESTSLFTHQFFDSCIDGMDMDYCFNAESGTDTWPADFMPSAWTNSTVKVPEAPGKPVPQDMVLSGTSAAITSSSGEYASTKRKAGEPLQDGNDEIFDDDVEKDEKRARNREHAKRSRWRKKFMLDALEARLMNLRRENLELRLVVQQKIPDMAEKILDDGRNAASKLLGLDAEVLNETAARVPSAIAHMTKEANLNIWRNGSQSNFLIVAAADNFPIMYASPSFLQLSGYCHTEIMGKSFTFMCGPATNPSSIEVLNSNMQTGRDTNLCLLNYKKDGSMFWNHIYVQKLHSAEDRSCHFMVMCVPVGTMAIEEFRRRLRKVPIPEELLHDDALDVEEAEVGGGGPAYSAVGDMAVESPNPKHIKNGACDPLKRTRASAR